MRTKCPRCKEMMIPGSVSVHGTFLTFSFIGFSIQYCWFYPEGKGKKQLVIRKGGHEAGLRCPNCLLTMVLPEPPVSETAALEPAY